MESAPILSTPDTYLLDATEPVAKPQSSGPSRSDEELSIIYDIERTLAEIRQGRWKRIALQFPDDMLPDAPRVFQLLTRGLQVKDVKDVKSAGSGNPQATNGGLDTTESTAGLSEKASQLTLEDDNSIAEPQPRFYILADTSYGTCCVDEVAAEHVDAEVVVHYGRSCLSPTSRLPVIYVFTHRPLLLEPLVKAFKDTYSDLSVKIIIAADVTYADHVKEVHDRLVQEGYTNLFATEVVHNPSSAIPNRTVPESVRENPESLSEWELFHISDPPTALLLTLSSKVATIHIYPTENVASGQDVKPLPASTAAALRRRYGVLVSLSTAPIFGILVNTLSVKNYLHIVDHVRKQIAAAGKKSYMFVVGKLNAAKVANFSEIDGWIVIGCWESSLVDSKEFWKPVITPYELEIALQSDDTRVWSGAWRSDYQAVLDTSSAASPDLPTGSQDDSTAAENETTGEDIDEHSDSESAPPEFNLKTGQFVTNSRPMHYVGNGTHARPGSNNTALAKRAKGDLAMIGSTVSPGAEFLRSQRTWQGLGSDFEIKYEEDDEAGGSAVVEGRRGIARGYAVGGSSDRH
jgi:diphthamide biosynthesis protein 2